MSGHTLGMRGHTPGPWAQFESNYGDGSFYCHWPRMSVHFFDRMDPRVEANARLIAAAPDLLEALKEARSTVASMTILDMTKGDVPMHPKMLAMIDAALIKAEKGAQ